MGHIMVRTMRRAQEALRALTPEQHGVDGRAIYLYGEAWDFGEVAGNQRGSNASQLNISGTGLGALPTAPAGPRLNPHTVLPAAPSCAVTRSFTMACRLVLCWQAGRSRCSLRWWCTLASTGSQVHA